MTVTLLLRKIVYKEAMRNKIYNIKKGKREKGKFFGGTFLRAKKWKGIQFCPVASDKCIRARFFQNFINETSPQHPRA